MRCPQCGQKLLPPEREGCGLTPLKARIYDAVKRAGPDGIAWHDLFALIYGGCVRGSTSRQRLKSHVWQINDLLEDSGWRIGGYGGTYILRRVVRDASGD